MATLLVACFISSEYYQLTTCFLKEVTAKLGKGLQLNCLGCSKSFI